MIGTYFPGFRRVLFLCAALVCILSRPLLAQPPAPQDNPQAKPAAEPAASDASQTPMIRTNVDEVSLDIVVHDKGKRLILDVKPEDLAVTDNGTPVKLSGLRLVRNDSTRRHLVTMVFDPFVGTTAKGARNAAEKILKVLPSDGYSISVLDVRGRLRLIQGFTEDRKAVSTAIEVATESNAQRLDSTLSKDLSVVTEHADAHRNQVVSDAEKNLMSIVRTGADTTGAHLDVTQRSYAQSLLSAMQESQKGLQDKHGYLNLGGILSLIHSQQKLGDRKALIYFTHNVVMDNAAKEMLKTISADSTRAGVTIYTIDLDALNETGQYQLDNAMLNGQPPFNPGKIVVNPHGDTATPIQQATGGPIQGDLQPDGSRSWGAKQDIQMMTDFTRRDPGLSWGDMKSPMAQLSKDTGGIYMDAQGNLKKLLEQMVEDLGTYYEATYVPPIKEYDGSFRAIEIKPLRTGIRVQSKTGYYAVAPGADEGIRPFEVPLLKALSQAALPTDVKFRASVLRFGELPDGNTSTFALEIPVSSLQTKEDTHTNLYSAQATVYAEIKDAAGTLVERFGDNLTRRGALESLDRDQAAPLAFARHFLAMPGKYTLNIAVADQLSGKMGAETVSFEIPETAKSLALSDMVVVRKLDALHEDDDDLLNPLRYEHDRITPDLSSQLAAGTKGLSLFFMLHPDAASKDTPTLEMEVIHNGAAGRRTPLPLNLNADQAAIPYLASFGSGAVAQGRYEVKAYLTQGGKTAMQSVAFNVGDGAAAATANLAGKSSDTGVTAIAAAPEVNVPGQLSITAMKDPTPPLSAQDAHLLIEDARDRAVGYSEGLPNFMVIEVINRSVDSSAMGNWKLKDSIVELLRYRDKHETRTTLEINGEASSTDHAAMKDALSTGEFGGVLKSVFSPDHQAQFQWKETDELNGGSVQVFDFTVDQAHSKFGVVGTSGREIITGFHGQVFVDSATRSVRRISLIADLPKELPRDFSTRGSNIRVDYDYVAINGHDYLLPVSAEMRLIKGKHFAALNTIEFRNYKRFGSNMRVLGFTPIEGEQKD
ncbi:MAG TPA: VWA domain-containing protein [Terracidiphilus sp.]|jgi:VWFA-related protein